MNSKDFMVWGQITPVGCTTVFQNGNRKIAFAATPEIPGRLDILMTRVDMLLLEGDANNVTGKVFNVEAFVPVPPTPTRLLVALGWLAGFGEESN